MEKILLKDVYNEVGLLVIAKGSKILVTNENKDKLESLGIIDSILGNIEEDKGETKIQSTNSNEKLLNVTKNKKQLDIKEIAKSFILDESIYKDKTFIKISDMTNDIIHNNRNESWYSHLNALVNYVNWIYAHSINTALLSGIIGIRMGYSSDRLYQLTLGAILHDIGMILIPREILIKPSKLSKDEMSFVQKHCELGCAMVEGIQLSNIAKGVILQHHERTDGSGYPFSLNESELSEESKIVMIADSFDTATSHRPYKPDKDIITVINQMTNDNRYDKKIVGVLKDYLIK